MKSASGLIQNHVAMRTLNVSYATESSGVFKTVIFGK